MSVDHDRKNIDTIRTTSSLGEGTVHEVHKGKITDDMDDAILKANGHEAVLERQFSWISALALGFSITNSWIGYLVRVI